MPPGMRVWLLVGLVIGWATSGCTLLGAGVGAGIDAASPGPYESKPVGSQLQLEHGDDIILLMYDGLRLEGEYVGLHGPTKQDPEIYVLLEGGYGVQSVPLSDVRSIAVDVSGLVSIHDRVFITTGEAHNVQRGFFISESTR